MIYQVQSFETSVTNIINELTNESCGELVIFDQDFYNQKLELPTKSMRFMNSAHNINLTLIQDINELEGWIVENIATSSITIFGLIDMATKSDIPAHQLNYLMYRISKLSNVTIAEPQEYQPIMIMNVDEQRIPIDMVLQKWLN